jgi:hypothetical protein
LGNCSFDDCRFGHQGTPGAIHQAVYAGGTNARIQFSNNFRNCYFSQQVGCKAALEFGLGHDLSFNACTFDSIDTRVLYARGTTTVTMQACNFEAINPTDANDVIFDIADDLEGIGHRTYLGVFGSRFTLTDGQTTALTYLDPNSLFVLENSNLSMLNNYYTMKTGPIYDSRLVLRNNRVTGELGTTLEYASTAFTQQINTDTPWRLQEQAADPDSPTAGDVSLSDGTTRWDGNPGFRRYTGSAWEDLSPGPTTKTVIKTIDLDDDASTDDYQFDDDAANKTEQVITLTNILPAYAELVSWQIRCFEGVADANTFGVDFGTTSGGTEIGEADTDDTNEILASAAGAGPTLAATNAVRSLYFAGTPSVNWSIMHSTGRWAVMLTYIDYSAVYTQKNP